MRGKNGVELISDRTLDIASGLYGEAEDELAVMAMRGEAGKAQYSFIHHNMRCINPEFALFKRGHNILS